MHALPRPSPLPSRPRSSWTVPRAPRCLRSQLVRAPGNALSSALDDLPLPPHAWAASSLQAFRYGPASTGCEDHVDKRLLTLIWAPGQPGLQVSGGGGLQRVVWGAAVAALLGGGKQALGGGKQACHARHARSRGHDTHTSAAGARGRGRRLGRVAAEDGPAAGAGWAHPGARHLRPAARLVAPGEGGMGCCGRVLRSSHGSLCCRSLQLQGLWLAGCCLKHPCPCPSPISAGGQGRWRGAAVPRVQARRLPGREHQPAAGAGGGGPQPGAGRAAVSARGGGRPAGSC